MEMVAPSTFAYVGTQKVFIFLSTPIFSCKSPFIKKSLQIVIFLSLIPFRSAYIFLGRIFSLSLSSRRYLVNRLCSELKKFSQLLCESSSQQFPLRNPMIQESPFLRWNEGWIGFQKGNWNLYNCTCKQIE